PVRIDDGQWTQLIGSPSVHSRTPRKPPMSPRRLARWSSCSLARSASRDDGGGAGAGARPPARGWRRTPGPPRPPRPIPQGATPRGGAARGGAPRPAGGRPRAGRAASVRRRGRPPPGAQRPPAPPRSLSPPLTARGRRPPRGGAGGGRAIARGGASTVSIGAG